MICWQCGEPFLLVLGEVRCPSCGAHLRADGSQKPAPDLIRRIAASVSAQLGVPLADDFEGNVAAYEAVHRSPVHLTHQVAKKNPTPAGVRGGGTASVPFGRSSSGGGSHAGGGRGRRKH